MWYLDFKNQGHDTKYWLQPIYGCITLGLRSDSYDIVLGCKEPDALVSAAICFVNDSIQNGKRSGIKLVDFGCKRGLYINDKLVDDECVDLSHGDRIKIPHVVEFEIKWHPIIICIRKDAYDFSDVELYKWESCLRDHDIQYSYEWNSECTHLLMRHYKFDYAVLHALAEVKPIINPKWIEHLEVMRDGSLVRMFQLPDETNYLPEAKDEVPRLNIELFKANVKRKTLLSGTVFVLPEEQYNETSSVMQLIKKVGGQVELYTVPTLNEHELCTIIAKNERKLADAHRVCYLTPSKADLCSMLCHILRSMRLRLINPDEVLTAIYKVDADTYCDPKKEATSSKLYLRPRMKDSAEKRPAVFKGPQRRKASPKVNMPDLNKYRNFNRSRFKPANTKRNYSKTEQAHVDDPMDVDTGQSDEFERWQADLAENSKRAWH
ncbi:6089_t:CDS:2 [Paraglomus brasilianum]|uniref:6089_t:CDS:1 n=1 Tax=Paraglomus brasilianum TaxID=144538 RepID=A0A9N8Z070_9GLOM|nr:6089_t:CDS:2 [Paraglomus brasilianum]